MTRSNGKIPLADWQCGATTRRGTPCRRARTKGRGRYRLHGGSKRSGGQPGNTNAWKHGYYSVGAMAERRRLAEDILWVKKAMRALKMREGFNGEA